MIHNGLCHGGDGDITAQNVMASVEAYLELIRSMIPAKSSTQFSVESLVFSPLPCIRIFSGIIFSISPSSDDLPSGKMF